MESSRTPMHLNLRFGTKRFGPGPRRSSARVPSATGHGTAVTEAALQSQQHAAQLAALGTTHAMLTCALDGTILSANAVFLQLLGWTAQEVVGQHHSMLVAPHRRESTRYHSAWETLRSGKSIAGELPHLAKDGRTVWLQGAYSPVLDRDGKPVQTIAIGIDVTAAKERSVDDAGQVRAIRRSQAVVTFDLTGTVLSANENFLHITGYDEAEVVGQHHRIFVGAEEAVSPAYKAFWQRLTAGEFHSAEFKRFAKSGAEVWFQASYNPVFDANDKLIKVVKYATDITEEIKRRTQLKLLSLMADKSDISVSITDPESRIIYVNRGYERMTGFTAAEIMGCRPGDVANGPATDLVAFARLKAGLASGKPIREELLVYSKDKRPFWISVTMNPVFDDAGKLIHFVAVQTDITATKQDAVAFNTKLLAISQSNAMAEWMADGTPVSANALLCGAEFGLALSTLLTASDMGELKRHRQHRKALAIPRDGRDPLWVDATFSVLADLEGRPSRILMCGTDITARQQAIAASIANMTQMVQRITGVMQTVGRFASQTNLLALNAAIEAARAQQSGSEFGLIAQEIRKLSVEASAAIKQISTLLAESQVQITSMSSPDGGAGRITARGV